MPSAPTSDGRRPRLTEVAAKAGVSLGTVSNVLNRPEVVAERTRKRVLAAIAELGFVRNESARQLRGGGSRTLAYVVLDTRNPFFTDEIILFGLRCRAIRHGEADRAALAENLV